MTGARAAGDAAALAALLGCALWLFRGHVSGELTYLGNPDRLNSHLKVLKHHLDTLSEGGIAAWSGREMLGYDSFALPYTFPNPLTWLTYAFGPEQVYVVAGFVSIGLLACGGLAAYAALRAFVSDPLAAAAGALVYQFSALSVLKASQNDMSFAVLIVIPLGVLVLRTIDARRPLRGYFLLALLLAAMLHFMFLQKAAYALLLLGSYAVYRSWVQRSALPAVAFFAAFAGALVLAAPRIAGVALAISQYVRVSPGHDLSGFAAIYEFQNIRPYEILRWLEGSVFGRSPSEAAALGNNINLTEGVLLFSGCAATLLALAALARLDGRWLRLVRERRDDGPFFAAALVACLAVVVWKPALRVVYELFLRMDFTHARILVAALFPFALIVALAVGSLRRGALPGTPFGAALALAAGIAAAHVLAYAAEQATGTTTGWEMRMRNAALVGFLLTAVLLALGYAGQRAVGLDSRAGALLAAMVPGLVIGQSLLQADSQVNPPAERRSGTPFRGGDLYSAPRSQFHPPSAAAVAALQAALESDRYRTAVICDPDVAGGFCAAHMANFWKLRLVDGYYGLGVPARIAALPWPNGLSLRALLFTQPQALPWELLAVLNVKYALTVSGAWYANAFDGAPSPPRVALNPHAPAPRAFFAEEVRAAASVAEAVRHITADGVAVTRRSWAEGAEAAAGMPADAPIRLSEGPDWIEARFAPVAVPRFLVLNELFSTGWQAVADDQPAPILATNAFMRGVRVPAGASRVRFDYTPVTRQPVAWVALGLGAVLLALGAWATILAARAQRPRA